MPQIKLWYSAGACSLVPHVLLHEVGLPFEATAVSVADGETLTDAFARINPKRRVPVLLVDGSLITEVPAIAAAIADLEPERELLGRSGIERVRVQEWMAWLSGTLHGQGFGGVFRPQRFTERPDQHDGVRARGRETIAEAFEAVEAKLGGLHAIGDAFTAVDPYLLVFYRWGNGIGIDMPRVYPRYGALARRLVRRPSVQAALTAEGIAAQALRDRVPALDDA